MYEDPKKGGKCWSCKYCEDIATQTNNPAGSYYRKCNKSGHEYVDTCKFSCSDYVWDGKDEDFRPSTTSTASSGSYSSNSSLNTGSASRVGLKLVGTLITTAIFGFIAYVLLGYSEFLLASTLVENPPLPLLKDAFLTEAVIVFGPFVLSILWSIIRRRKIWIGALLTMIACTAINGAIGEDTTLSHIPLFIVSVAVPYLLCLVAILKEKKSTVSTSSTATPSNKASTATSTTTTKTYSDYKCYQCSYYKVDADYNGICTRNNSLVDRYQTACKNCSR